MFSTPIVIALAILQVRMKLLFTAQVTIPQPICFEPLVFHPVVVPFPHVGATVSRLHVEEGIRQPARLHGQRIVLRGSIRKKMENVKMII